MKVFYVSMAADLLGVYIEYQAESRKALEQYLQRQYLRNGIWKLPWCAIYEEKPISRLSIPFHFVAAQCGQVTEENE